MSDPIKPGDVVEHKDRPGLGAWEVHDVFEDLIFLVGPFGSPFGPLQLSNYRKIHTSSKEN